MEFEFEKHGDRDRVLDMSLWDIHGHCLNMKMWEKNQRLEEVDFGTIRMWVQAHGLSGEMINGDNERQIASKVGKGLAFASEQEMQARGYIRFQAELSTSDPLCPRF